MISTYGIGLPPDIVAQIQQGTLERVFHENLFPRLLYRSEAMRELWVANIGESKLMTRTGLLPRVSTPLTPGVDPDAETFAVEQWRAEARQFGSSIKTHMPSSHVALAPLYLRDIQELGKQAGLSINALARNALYTAYLAGDSVTLAVGVVGSFQLRVASVGGFMEKLQNGRPAPVSSLNPLPVTFPGTAEPANTVVGALPDVVSQPYGPGTISLGTALATAIIARSRVLAANASSVRRAGGVNTVDGLTGTSLLTLQQVISGVAELRANNVPPQADGYYHVHVTPEGEAQLYADEQFQRLFQSLPDSMEYRDLAIGQLVGCRFYRNTENPNLGNVGGTVNTGSGGPAAAKAAPFIGGEVINNNGLAVKRAMIIGGGALYEPYIDESSYITAAGVNGKIGEFSVVNGGVQVLTDGIRLILRAPQDKLQQVVDSSWSWTGDFAVPSDELTGSAARVKRAVVLEHA